jgi:deoxycytidine triphosphate deaminase
MSKFILPNEITNLTKSIYTKETQHGYDLSVKSIMPFAGRNHETDELLYVDELKPYNDYIDLLPLTGYIFFLNEQVTYTENMMCFIRSSLNRCGIFQFHLELHPNYTALKVITSHSPVKIQLNSRVCQIIKSDTDIPPTKTIRLTLKFVSEINGGVIGNSTTAVNEYTPQDITVDNTFIVSRDKSYVLHFNEGCDIQNNELAFIDYDSYDFMIKSPLFDAGFKTEKISSFAMFMEDTILTVGQEICNLEFYESSVIEKLYNGQWQGK